MTIVLGVPHADSNHAAVSISLGGQAAGCYQSGCGCVKHDLCEVHNSAHLSGLLKEPIMEQVEGGVI